MDGDNIFGTTEYVDVGSFTDEQSTNTEVLENKDTATDTGIEETVKAPESDGQGESEKEITETKAIEETPKKILGKFNSEEDLKKAYNSLARKIEAENNQPYGSIKPTEDSLVDDYQSLQSYYTQLRQAKASQQTASQVESKKAEEQRKAEEAEYEAKLVEWYNEEVLVNPLNANAVLNQYQIDKANRIAEEKAKQQADLTNTNESRLKAIYERNPDITEYNDAINEEIEAIAQEEPSLLQSADNQPIILEKAYSRAKIKSLENKVKELTDKLQNAFENGKKASSNVEAQKSKLSNETGNSKGDSVDTGIPAGLNIINNNDMLL